MAAGYSLRPRIWPLVLGALACAAAIALGNWQSRRADDKRVLGEQLDAALKAPPVELSAGSPAHDLALKHVAARGMFVAAHTVFLDNKLRHGKPGYEVVTPLLLSPSLGVLVQRGWIERSRREAVRTPKGAVRIEGLALEHLPRVLEVREKNEGPVRQNLDIGQYATEIGLALQPVVIQQRSDDGDGLARDWPRPDFGIDMHRAYAVQWYALAGLAVVLGIVFSFRRVA